MGVKYGVKTKVKLLKRLKGHKRKHLRILNLVGTQEFVYYLYKESKIDKLKNIIKANWLVSDQLKTICQKLLSNFFTLNTPVTQTQH